MKTSKRFDSAVKKLYQAFHNNTLNPEDCAQCAVGNILDNNDFWRHLTDIHGSVKLNYVGLVHQNLGRRFNGYLPLELLKIEAAFLKGCGYRLGTNYCHKPEYLRDQYILFNGLCEVISTLCKLDKISYILECSTLFNFRNQLTELTTLEYP
ncbi:MAG: Na(+)-translocating NADH-quinone reductase subunit F [Winogradskyella sp.]|uniref:Na(+)-translocating NADH-quinone reductase subunit F n=1 Tax=Winogradskyella sp. TaxID=1883156 RepID=UPI0017F3D75D|nr:Na(+)-translocating NADH-quinone reductase subunit F [Winogradskyella sp.]